MKVFVTGASGWIGSAVIPELLQHGHTVVGLARSDKSAQKLKAAGVEVVRGTIDNLDVLRSTAAATDGVIHLAFDHDLAFTGDFAGAANSDRRAVELFGEVLAGTNKPLVIASGLLGLVPGRLATEHDGLESSPVTMSSNNGPQTRMGTAHVVLGLAANGVRSSVVRLAPTVHGVGDKGFMATLVSIAQTKVKSGYIGDRLVRWPAVHRKDAAVMFRLALENAPAGSVLHAVAEEGVPIKDIATVIGKHVNVPVVSITPNEAPEQFGFLAMFLGIDSPVSSDLTRQLLDWQPKEPGLIADLDQGYNYSA